MKICNNKRALNKITTLMTPWKPSFQSANRSNHDKRSNEEQYFSDHEALNGQILKTH